MNIQRSLFICLCCGLISVLACSSPTLYDEKYVFEDDIWMYSDTASFKWTVKDTSKVFNMSIVLGHDAEFGFQNVYLKFLSKFPKNDWVEQILPINLAVNSGQWIGQCKGSNCSIEYDLQESAYFRNIGEHELLVVQHGRLDSLQGIRFVELILQEAN